MWPVRFSSWEGIVAHDSDLGTDTRMGLNEASVELGHRVVFGRAGPRIFAKAGQTVFGQSMPG